MAPEDTEVPCMFITTKRKISWNQCGPGQLGQLANSSRFAKYKRRPFDTVIKIIFLVNYPEKSYNLLLTI